MSGWLRRGLALINACGSVPVCAVTPTRCLTPASLVGGNQSANYGGYETCTTPASVCPQLSAQRGWSLWDVQMQRRVGLATHRVPYTGSRRLQRAGVRAACGCASSRCCVLTPYAAGLALRCRGYVPATTVDGIVDTNVGSITGSSTYNWMYFKTDVVYTE